MMTADILVFLDPDGRHYIALLGEDARWWRWPAEAHGWRSRERCQPSVAERCYELEPRLAQLALRLSGVES